MIDTITLNPTEYIILISVWFGLGYFVKWLLDKVMDYLNKYFYIKS